jgi:hypothetical protein
VSPRPSADVHERLRARRFGLFAKSTASTPRSSASSWTTSTSARDPAAAAARLGGGQKGLRSVIAHLGTTEFPRLRDRNPGRAVLPPSATSPTTSSSPSEGRARDFEESVGRPRRPSGSGSRKESTPRCGVRIDSPSSPGLPTRIDIHEEASMRLYDIVVLVTPDLNDDDARPSRGRIPRRSWSDGGRERREGRAVGQRRPRLSHPAKARSPLHVLAGRGRPERRRRGRAPHGPLPTRSSGTSPSASTRSSNAPARWPSGSGTGGEAAAAAAGAPAGRRRRSTPRRPKGASHEDGTGIGRARRRGAAAGRDGKGGPRKKFFVRRRKVCKFCAEKLEYIDWKDVKLLQGFIPEQRQDPAAAHLGNVRAASTQAADGHQARALDRAAAVRDGLRGCHRSSRGMSSSPGPG